MVFFLTFNIWTFPQRLQIKLIKFCISRCKNIDYKERTKNLPVEVWNCYSPTQKLYENETNGVKIKSKTFFCWVLLLSFILNLIKKIFVRKLSLLWFDKMYRKPENFIQAHASLDDECNPYELPILKISSDISTANIYVYVLRAVSLLWIQHKDSINEKKFLDAVNMHRHDAFPPPFHAYTSLKIRGAKFGIPATTTTQLGTTCP